MTPEQLARQGIDKQLEAADWIVQHDFRDIHITAGLNVAVRDVRLKDSAGLPSPGLHTQKIADNLETALEQFQSIASALRE